MVPAIDVYLDSSLLVEYVKAERNDRVEFMEKLLEPRYRLWMDYTVLSEYLFHFVGFHGGKSPLTLKVNAAIPDVLNRHLPESIFQHLMLAQPAADLRGEVVRLMRTYNLLPNDAIILAHCLSLGIKFLASHDTTDFAVPCQAEGITLLDRVEALDLHVPTS